MLQKLILMVWVLTLPVLSYAQVKPEAMPTSIVLPAETNPHWVWINDIVFHHMADGKSYLVDGDSGKFLGMLSTGLGFIALELPSDYSQIYSPETYFSRGTRGERTDVITFYDPRELKPTGEVIIPPKRFAAMPTLNYSSITDDDRFLIVYNFTPAQSVSVIDLKERRFVGETDTGGCALVLASGDRRFNMLCGDGSLMTVTLDDPEAAQDLDEAPVDVDVVGVRSDDVLAVPVAALIALTEGGYAVEVVADDGSTVLIAVDPGLFADGRVEVSSDGLDVGMAIVIP